MTTAREPTLSEWAMQAARQAQADNQALSERLDAMANEIRELRGLLDAHRHGYMAPAPSVRSYWTSTEPARRKN